MSAPSLSRPFPRWLAPALLVLANVVAYAPSLRAPFIFDDVGAVLQNSTIRHLSLGALNPPADGGTTTGRPLVNLTLAFNYAISGESPWSYHALNLAIHLAAALTLFGLLRRTLSTFDLQLSTSVAFTTALLWALHPLQTETIACTAQRTESLCALFYLLTLYCFARATPCHPIGDKHFCPPEGKPETCNLIGYKRAGPYWLVISIFSCVAGMACKEVMVTAPLVALLYDRTFVAGNFSTALRARRGYYAALAATWFLLAVLVLRGSGTRGVAAGFGLGVSPWHYLLTQCDALVVYLRLTLWPHPLVLDYGTAIVTSPAAVWWQGLTILGSLGTTMWALARRPRFGFALACFFVVLAPSSSFLPLVTQTIAEHRMYLPLATVLALVVLGAHRLLGSRAVPMLAALALATAGVTFARTQLYASPVALWSADVAHRPHARSLAALGVAYLHAGRPADALPFFDRALTLDPTHLSASRNRALALLHLSRAAEAATILSSLPAREPGEAEEFFTLGNAFAREQKFAEAAAAFTRTVTVAPTHAAAHANLGNCLLVTGRPAEAIAEYETVLRLQPDDTRARENLSLAREALAHARRP